MKNLSTGVEHVIDNALVLGRQKLTGIKSLKCSRKQVFFIIHRG